MGSPDRVFLNDEEKKAIQDFVKEQFDEKGAEKFQDDMAAADANLAELVPGKTVSCDAIAKARKQLGLMLPRGRGAKKDPTKSLVKKWSKKKVQTPKESSALDLSFSGTIQETIDLLKEQKTKIDAAILAMEALTKVAL